MEYCARCLYPANAKPTIILDEEGVCSGCRYHESRDAADVDWEERQEIFEELDEKGLVVAKHYHLLKMRYVFRYEMQYLLEVCGYEAEALYGDFQNGPIRHGGEQIWIARKA